MTTGIAVQPGFVSGSYAQALVQAARTLGISLPGPPVAQGNWQEPIAVGRYLSWMEAGARQHAAFGVIVGQTMTPSAYPILSHTVMACSTLSEVIELVLRYESLNHDLGRSVFEAREDHGYFCWVPREAILLQVDELTLAHLVASVFSGIQSFTRHLFDPLPRFRHLELQVANPELQKALSRQLSCPVHADGERNTLVFALSLLSLSVRTADPASLEAMRQHAEALLQSRRSEEPGIVTLLRDVLASRLSGDCSLSAIADAMQLSPRTLQRRLKSAGTHFQQELDEVRLHKGRVLLAQGELQIGEVAFRLGFQEQSSFNHLFRQKTGLSPGAYRQQLIGGK